MNKAVEDALNEQLNAELYSSYLYLAMAADFGGRSLNGMSSWLRQQANEETEHAMKFFDFLLDRGSTPMLKAIAQPPSGFASPLEAFELVLEHERKVTASIHSLVELATKEGDHASQPFLAWFVSEQIEEEQTASEIVDQFRMIGDEPAGILMMDRALAARAG